MLALFATLAVLAAPVARPTATPERTPVGPKPDLTTVFEKSGGTRTGRYDEVIRLCTDFVAAFPGRAKCEDFGTTPEGRPMLALVASEDGALDPDAARAKNRPVVFFQGGIHAGEIDGKDAGFVFLRELLDGTIASKIRPKEKALPTALSKVTLVFVPVFNVDGSERVSKFHRPNQRGPEEQGWRVTAQNLNLNRDYTKADAPEMQAMLGLLDAWDPAVYLDLHVTDGAKFQHDVSVLISPLRDQAPSLVAKSEALRKEVATVLTKEKHLPITEFYPAFEKDDDPASGFGMGVAPPRFSQTYWAERNRTGILVETHSWKPYAVRVQATHDVLAAVVANVARDPAGWLAADKDGDARGKELAGKDDTLAWKHTAHSHTIDFLGYAYTKAPSDVSGGTWIRYDETKPQVWKIPLFDELVPALQTKAPKAGYVIPAAWSKLVVQRLALHGIEYTVLKDPRPALAVETFRATKATPAPDTYEGRTRMTFEGAWSAESRDLPAGSVFVPIAQPKARLVLDLLEPQAPDSFAAWGFFNAAFEQKEYMEAYVAEEVARDMLAKDSALKTQFDAALVADSSLRASPSARLDWFYRKSPWWDDRVNLYPVFRVETAP